jgi:hypothetical protein
MEEIGFRYKKGVKKPSDIVGRGQVKKYFTTEELRSKPSDNCLYA